MKRLKMSTENELNELNELLKNDLIKWIITNHSNKGNDFINALNFVNDHSWNDIIERNESQWSDCMGIEMYNKINELNTKQPVKTNPNEKTLQNIHDDLYRKNRLIDWINQEMTDPNYEPYKVKALDFIHRINWNFICTYKKEDWVEFSGSRAIGILLFRKIDELKSKKGF